MSLFVGYFGTDRVYDHLAHHTIVLGPRYRDLLKDIFRRKVLAYDFSLYLHAPARTDPGMAPDGRDAFYVLSPVPNNTSGVDWQREAEPYFDRILEALERRVMPGLTDHVVTRATMTRLRAGAGPDPVGVVPLSQPGARPERPLFRGRRRPPGGRRSRRPLLGEGAGAGAP